MQQEFINGVRELHKATRPHVNYVKDFERRAANTPKACAEEALRELIAGSSMLLRAFKQAFNEDFEQAYNRTFHLTPQETYALREDAELPGDPMLMEFFLLWLYWLHFYRITLGFFERCVSAPGGPHIGHARLMCESFVKHEHASFFAYLMVADDVAKRFPKRADVRDALIEQFSAYFVIHMSLHINKRLGKVIAELKQQDETGFERLIKEASGEVWTVWQEQRASRGGEWFDQEHLMQMRSEIARRIEKRVEKQSATPETDLALFAEREKLLKQAKDAGLSSREHELFGLVMQNPERFLRSESLKLNHTEAAHAMGVTVGTTKSMWSRTKKKIFAA